ncbi:CarD family transcriptional regulator [Bacillus glycinifermentans]|uniref:CarD family transcriptional regulator n=1 Tax=Bacillus glycinifermentans TaxID=1664069 RepID=UPI0022E4EEB5|nr:CarD family transcriptional regulator [Bacillus glycinifermentans]
MLKEGDKVLYPLHGVGYLKSIEIQKAKNNSTLYYKIYIPARRLEIYVPKERAEKLGLRPISSIKDFLSICKKPYDYRVNLTHPRDERKVILEEKFKSGTLCNITQLARDLKYIYLTKTKISVEEMGILKSAKEILENEIMMMKDISLKEARLLLECKLFRFDSFE